MCLKKVSKMTIMTLKGYVENFLSILRSKSDSFEIFLISEILSILKLVIDFKKKAKNLGDFFHNFDRGRMSPHHSARIGENDSHG